MEIPDSVTSIGNHAFEYCGRLTSVVIPDSVTSIRDFAFEGCSSLTSVYYKGTASEWSAISIGSYNDKLKSATRYYYSETEPALNAEGTAYDGNYWHYDEQGAIVVWTYTKPSEPATEGVLYQVSSDGAYVEVIGYEGTATEVKIEGTYNGLPVTTIAENAFSGKSEITSVTIPDSVTSIGDLAFADCSSLTSVEIPDSVTSIGVWAFSSCSSLTSVVIGDSVTSIGNSAFSSCSSLTSIEVSADNTAYQSIDGNLYTKDGKTLIQYAIGKTATSFTIPGSVASIDNAAFAGCSSLTSVVIPDSVTSIGDIVFADCISLTSVVIGDSVTSIGERAFSYCNGLTSVTIPDNVTSIGLNAFEYCNSLTSVVIGDSVTSIGGSAFRGCSSLTSVYYKGTAGGWSSISLGPENSSLTNATRYYYSETAPTEEGNYWHYDEQGAIVVWA